MQDTFGGGIKMIINDNRYAIKNIMEDTDWSTKGLKKIISLFSGKEEAKIDATIDLSSRYLTIWNNTLTDIGSVRANKMRVITLEDVQNIVDISLTDFCVVYGCGGEMEMEDRCTCSTSSNPPCGPCESNQLICSQCGWGTSDNLMDMLDFKFEIEEEQARDDIEKSKCYSGDNGEIYDRALSPQEIIDIYNHKYINKEEEDLTYECDLTAGVPIGVSENKKQEIERGNMSTVVKIETEEDTVRIVAGTKEETAAVVIKSDIQSRTKYKGVLYDESGVEVRTYALIEKRDARDLMKHPAHIGYSMVVHKAVFVLKSEIPVIQVKL